MTPRAPVTLMSVLPLALAATVPAQQTGAVSGNIVDRESLQPIAQALVRVRGSELSALTDARGYFQIAPVPVGKQVLVVQHVAYGEHADSVDVPADSDVQLKIRLSRQAIQLSAIVVEARTELERRRLTSGHGFNEILRAQIDDAARRGLDLGQLLRDGMPGIRVRQTGRLGTSYCVEYRGGGSRGVSCNEVAVFIDGVRASAPSSLYSTLPLQQIERLELLSPGEAGTRYGLSAGSGVLVIETRQGPRTEMRRTQERQMLGFDWSLEASPYRWARVGTMSLLANAIGLGLGLVILDQCLYVRDQGATLGTRCGSLTTTGAGLLGLTLPGVSGSVAAHWAGATERSKGRVAPSAIMGTLTVATGYLLFVQGESGGSSGTRTAGLVVLTVGTPLVATFADRAFRALR